MRAANKGRGPAADPLPWQRRIEAMADAGASGRWLWDGII